MESGIYALVLKTDPSKFYIGSAIFLAQRKQRHLRELKNGTHFNPKLQNYYNHYGTFTFDFCVIEHVLPKNLLKREQYYIDTRNPFFNINPQATSRLGAKLSPESKNRIKESCKTRKPRSVLSYLRQFVGKLTS